MPLCEQADIAKQLFIQPTTFADHQDQQTFGNKAKTALFSFPLSEGSLAGPLRLCKGLEEPAEIISGKAKGSLRGPTQGHPLRGFEEKEVPLFSTEISEVRGLHSECALGTKAHLKCYTGEPASETRSTKCHQASLLDGQEAMAGHRGAPNPHKEHPVLQVSRRPSPKPQASANTGERGCRTPPLH